MVRIQRAIVLVSNHGSFADCSWLLSILDEATGYHVVRRLHGRKAKELLDDFIQGWVQWAGPPAQVTCDQERGFMKEFVDGMEMIGCKLKYIAGQAHWQAGAVERQNQWYRYIWDKVVAHTAPNENEIDYTLAMVAAGPRPSSHCGPRG